MSVSLCQALTPSLCVCQAFIPSPLWHTLIPPLLCQALTCLPCQALIHLSETPTPHHLPHFPRATPLPNLPLPYSSPISLSPYPLMHTLILSSTSPLPYPGPWEDTGTGRNQLPQISDRRLSESAVLTPLSQINPVLPTTPDMHLNTNSTGIGAPQCGPLGRGGVTWGIGPEKASRKYGT